MTNSKASKTRRRNHFRKAAIAFAALLVLAFCTALFAEWRLRRPLDTAPFLRAPESGRLLDREGRLLYVALDSEEHWRLPVSLDQCSPYLISATVATEDQRFWRHQGVDGIAVLRAVLQNVRAGGVRSGASTLTMQLVKLTHPECARGLSGKLKQAWLALRLERNTSKQEILRAYLNLAPYGANIQGIEAAARRYFGKNARELTVAESALLAGLPKSPTALFPLNHEKAAQARRDYVLHRMQAEGRISAEQLAQSLQQALNLQWQPLPTHAPHLAMVSRQALQAGKEISTTLDLTLQKAVEHLLPEYLKRFDNTITNAAAVVVEVASGEVRARAGSAGFFSAPGGQVDLCIAPRSPGSTLKPFTYGLAMERNVLYSSEMLLDDTLDLGSYNPGNFDGDYHGLVSAKQALAYSLNVPAVMALERVGVEPMLNLLRSMGFSGLTQPAGYYGLGLTLGNCEVTLEQLAAAYAMLAREGRYVPLKLYRSAGVAPSFPEPVFSRGTVLALFDMLEAPFPREFDADLVSAREVRTRVCWKTGTSAGFHDAWTVAFNKQYVVAVWVGNSDGRPTRRLIGAQAALPLAAKIFRALKTDANASWPPAQKDLRSTSICTASGLPATSACPAQRSVWLPADQYLNRRCDVHYPGVVDGEVLARWPGTPNHWDLAKITAPRPADQPLLAANTVKKLQITVPANGAEYLITGEAEGDQIKLDASLVNLQPLNWYLNGTFLGESDIQRPLYLHLAPGKHVLSCMSEGGQTDRVRFAVKEPEGTVELRVN